MHFREHIDSTTSMTSLIVIAHSRVGGSDGSIIRFAETELANRAFHLLGVRRPLALITHTAANDGLEDIIVALRDVADNYDVSYGDMCVPKSYSTPRALTH